MYVGRDPFYLRGQRERAIKRKEKIIKTKFGMDADQYRNSKENGYVRGMLDKGKVHCSCKMCKYEKHHDIEKPNVKSKKEAMCSEIDEYVWKDP